MSGREMPKKICTVCAVEFNAVGKAKTCSVECSRAAFLEYRRKWRRQPKAKAVEREYAREYRQRPEVKDANREHDRKRRERPEHKEYERERKQKSEYKDYMREYGRRPKRKEYMREYMQRPEVKETIRQSAPYRSPERKAQKRLYDQRPDAKASKIARRQTPEYREKAAERYQRPDVKKRQRNYLRGYRALAKMEAMVFARELLAGKYPDLIPADHEPCLLYTATCRETGQILYIGITEDWDSRQKQHAATHKGALWLPAAEINIDVYPSRTLAMAAEMLAIKEHGPVFNVIHNDRSRVAA